MAARTVTILFLIAACACAKNAPDARGYTDLMKAAERGRPEDLRELVRRGADPNYRGRYVTRYSFLFPFVEHSWEDTTKDGETALMVAARAGRADNVEVLLELGADPNIEALYGSPHRTALRIAAALGHVEIVRALVAAGVQRESVLAMALLEAIENDHADTARVLAEAGSGGGSLHPQALRAAVEAGMVDVLRALIRAGADLDGPAGAGGLLMAASSGNHECLLVLLEAGAPPDARGIPVGWTALGLVAGRGGLESAQALIERGADVNALQDAIDARHDTPLILAASRGDVKLVELLLRAGAKVDHKNSHGYTAVTAAQQHGHEAVVELLRRAGGREADVHTPALAEAVGRGDLAGVRELLRRGADPSVKTQRDARPLLSEAIVRRHPAVARALIEAKADVNAVDASAQTPLSWSIALGDAQSARLLIDAGADVNRRTRDWSIGSVAGSYDHPEILGMLLTAGLDMQGKTEALGKASEGGRVELVDMLLDSGVDEAGRGAALAMAAREGKLDVVRRLLAAETPVDHRDDEDMTPLMWAASEGMTEVAESLIRAGADVNARCDKPGYRASKVIRSAGFTALILAAYREHPTVVRLLIQSGADPRVRDSRDGTAMSLAVAQGHLESALALRETGVALPIPEAVLAGAALRNAARLGQAQRVKELLDRHVDPNAADEYGETALMLAAQHRRVEVVRLLLAAGADVNAKRGDGTNALYWAVSWKAQEIEKLLRQAGARDEKPAWATPGLRGTG